jgi:hypothetical protein
MKLHKKDLIILIVLILLFSTALYGQTTGTMSVTVEIKESTVNIQKTNTMIIESSSTQDAKIIKTFDASCCYCTQKYKDGTYIDEFKNSYLIDKSTNKPAITNLNKDTNRVIFCPQINLKK